MDIIDICVIVLALGYVSALIVRLGADCAKDVWSRTLDQLDYLDLIEANTVPFTYASEAILITVAATLKMIAYMPINFVKSLTKPAWQKTPLMRTADFRQLLRKDILLAVASMISGRPELASMLFTDTWLARLHTSYELQQQYPQKITAPIVDWSKV